MTDKMFSNLSLLGLLLALLLVAWTGTRLTWQILEPRPEVPAAAQTTDRQSIRQREDYAQTIQQAHLFGRPKQVAKPVKQAPVSRINLRLFGILATDDEQGLAMIGRNQNDLKLYRVGDRLPGAARLQEIRADHVLIRRNGQDEMLLLKPEKELIKVTPVERNALNQQTSGLSQLRSQILEKPDELARLVSVQPVERGGVLVGYAVSPQPAAAQLFRKLGLRRGDVVTRLNGIALDSPDSSLEALMQLGDASQLSMEVERGGQRITVQEAFD